MGILWIVIFKALFFTSFVLIFLLPRSLHKLIIYVYLELTSRLILTTSLLQMLGSTFSFVEENLRTLVEGHGEGTGTPLQYSCLENSMDGGAWWAAVHGITKRQTRLRNFPFSFHFHALEKEMATHSSVLAWRIPGMGEPGGLLSMASHSRT